MEFHFERYRIQATAYRSFLIESYTLAALSHSLYTYYLFIYIYRTTNASVLICTGIMGFQSW